MTNQSYSRQELINSQQKTKFNVEDLVYKKDLDGIKFKIIHVNRHSFKCVENFFSYDYKEKDFTYDLVIEMDLFELERLREIYKKSFYRDAIYKGAYFKYELKETRNAEMFSAKDKELAKLIHYNERLYDISEDDLILIASVEEQII